MDIINYESNKYPIFSIVLNKHRPTKLFQIKSVSKKITCLYWSLNQKLAILKVARTESFLVNIDLMKQI